VGLSVGECAIESGLFCLVHGCVSFIQEMFEADMVAIQIGDADGDADGNALVAWGDDHGVGDVDGTGTLCLGDDGGEFFSAGAAADVYVAEAVLDEAGNLLQDGIAGAVSPGIIDLLKGVHIDHEQGEGTFKADGALEFVFGKLDEVAAVAEAGEVIGVGLYFDFLLQLPFALPAALASNCI